jgi:hypothetical protein
METAKFWHTNSSPDKYSFYDEMRLCLCGTAATNRPNVHPPDDMSDMEHRWNDSDRENWRTRRKTCHSASLSIANPTWNALGVNLGLCDEKQATNHLCYGRASIKNILYFQMLVDTFHSWCNFLWSIAWKVLLSSELTQHKCLILQFKSQR